MQIRPLNKFTEYSVSSAWIKIVFQHPVAHKQTLQHIYPSLELLCSVNIRPDTMITRGHTITRILIIRLSDNLDHVLQSKIISSPDSVNLGSRILGTHFQDFQHSFGAFQFPFKQKLMIIIVFNNAVLLPLI